MIKLATSPLRIACTIFALQLLIIPWLRAQTGVKENHAVVEGIVHDSQDQPLAGIVISLESADPAHPLRTVTDSQGRFRLEVAPAKKYTLRVKSPAHCEVTEGPFALQARQTKHVAVLLLKASPKDAAAAMQFSDEPHFTVAGVTDTTALGGHGSDEVVRNSEALSKEAASLARGSFRQPDRGSVEGTEASLRASLAKRETAEAHFQLAQIEERHGQSLQAVKDYQRAAEMEPTEPHLFSWGAELLLHRANEPAAEVFSKGHRLYPHSVRMMLGLSAALYGEGRKEEAANVIMEASDLDPPDPSPYLFLGRLQATETQVSSAWVSRMRRFVEIHPENADAHCLYAIALAKQGREQQDANGIESQLKTAIALDPHLGSAYLQLGILLSQRKDYSGAIAAFQKAVENTALPDEAHYRLADLYRRIGEKGKADREIELFKQISTRKKQENDQQRREMQQFIYTLQSPSAPTRPFPASHH